MTFEIFGSAAAVLPSIRGVRGVVDAAGGCEAGRRPSLTGHDQVADMQLGTWRCQVGTWPSKGARDCLALEFVPVTAPGP
jgi:hypothetical protein